MFDRFVGALLHLPAPAAKRAEQAYSAARLAGFGVDVAARIALDCTTPPEGSAR
jgi:hypothetical protein